MATRTLTLPADQVSTPAPAVPVMAQPPELVDLIPERRGYKHRIILPETSEHGALTDLHLFEITHKRNLDAVEQHRLADEYETELAEVRAYNKAAERRGAKPKPLPKSRGNRRAFVSNILLQGPTGSGKTSALQHWCAMRNRPMVTVMPTMRVEHVFGGYVEDPTTGRLRWLHGPVTMLALYGHLFPNGAVLYLDEINRTPDEMVSWFYPAFDYRREVHLYEHPFKAKRLSDGMYLMDYDETDPDQVPVTGPAVLKLPANVLVVGSLNPQYLGTNPLNEAFANRFAVQFDYDYDADVEKQLVACPAILELAQTLRRTDLNERGAGTPLTTPISTNMLVEWESNIKVFGYVVAKRMFLAHFDGVERGTVERFIRDTAEEGIIEFFPGIQGERRPSV